VLSVCDPVLEIFDEIQQSKIEWIHWKTAVNLKKCTASRALEEPWNILINTVKSYLLTDPCF
jgi:hypothetical protein